MKKNNKGFTLIELLAIIVILSIIAVITVPIILNVIENAKKGSAVDSAYGYKDAVNKYYLSEMIENQDILLDGFYLIEDGKLKKGSEDSVEISFSGTAPSDGSLIINKGSVEAGCMVFDNYKVSMLNDMIYRIEKGTCNGIDVYFNPGSIEKNIESGTCTDYDSTMIGNSGEEQKEGCMKWYVLNVTDTSVDLLLDHNTARVLWITKDDYNQTGEKPVNPSNVGVTYPKIEEGLPTLYGTSANNRGPLTALDQLHKDTDDWAIPERTDSYTAEWKYRYNGEETEESYRIDYDKYKARMITAEEVAKITGQPNTKLQDIPESGFSFETYTWLIYNGGYWTSSPYTNIYIASNAWGMINYRLVSSDVYLASYLGIRPVITVSKSLLQ